MFPSKTETKIMMQSLLNWSRSDYTGAIWQNIVHLYDFARLTFRSFNALQYISTVDNQVLPNVFGPRDCRRDHCNLCKWLAMCKCLKLRKIQCISFKTTNYFISGCAFVGDVQMSLKEIKLFWYIVLFYLAHSRFLWPKQAWLLSAVPWCPSGWGKW